MEAVLFALGATLVVGSLSGLASSFRIGALMRRIEVLEARERRVGTAHVQVHAPVSTLAPAEPLVAPRKLQPTVGARIATPIDPPVPAPLPPLPGPIGPESDVRSPKSDWWKAFEQRVGTRWTSWLGAAALVIGAALFVKFAIQQGWVGPAARLALGTVGGIALLVAGWRAQRAAMRPLAHGLFGAGLGVLYVSVYVAFASHGLIPRELAVGAMISVTLVGGAIAVWFDAEVVAVLALLGGLFTPVAVSSGGGGRDELFTYLLVLDIGACLLALVRRWRAVEWIAIVGTWVLWGGWLQTHHVPAEWRGELAWLAAFHLVFLILPFGHHLRRQIALAPGRISMALVSASSVGCGAIIIADGQRNVLGAIALVMAATYYTLGAITRRRLPGDGRAHFGLTALAVACATSAVPLLLRDRGIVLAWSLEAPVLLALGFVHRYHALRRAALVLLGAAAAAVFALDPPGHAAVVFANLRFLAGLPVPIAAALFVAVHRALRARYGDDRDRWHGVLAGLGGAVVMLGMLHVELATWLADLGRPGAAASVAALVWAAGAAIAAQLGGRRRDLIGIVAGAGFVTVAAVLALRAYQLPLDAPLPVIANPQFGAGVATLLAGMALAIAFDRRDHHAGRQLVALVLAAFGALLGVEAYVHYRTQTALTVAWTSYAVVLLAFGFALQRRGPRLGGLGLLGVVASKLVLFDLSGAPPLHRVLSFLALGAVMIVASYAYHRLERR